MILRGVVVAAVFALLVASVAPAQESSEENRRQVQDREGQSEQEESAQLRYRTVNTEGVLSSVPVPVEWQGQYNRLNDVVVLLEPGQRQVMLFPYAGISAREAAAALLRDLGGPGYTDRIRQVTIGGTNVSSIRIDVGGESQDWVLAAERNGVIVAIWARTAGSLDPLEPIVTTVVRETRVAEPRRPGAAQGSYSMPSNHSITLRENGEFTRTTENAEIEGRWELRGNRLLLISEDDFSNMRVSLGEEGITVYGANDTERQWERR